MVVVVENAFSHGEAVGVGVEHSGVVELLHLDPQQQFLSVKHKDVHAHDSEGNATMFVNYFDRVTCEILVQSHHHEGFLSIKHGFLAIKSNFIASSCLDIFGVFINDLSPGESHGLAVDVELLIDGASTH